ncbi:MAG: hypothetical protein AUI10_08145 [Actinobacteria bacterium 13_2_20CM_2_72_6]|nr:MAG: hypothetical protein AUI10_08145 [Actinobacteria bacterium 13_2_20CM_2_72_6]
MDNRRNGWVASARKASRSRPAPPPRHAAAAVARRIQRTRRGSHPSNTNATGTASSSSTNTQASWRTVCCSSRPASASDRAASAAFVNGPASESPATGTRCTFDPASESPSAIPVPALDSFWPGTPSLSTRSKSLVASQIQNASQATTSRSVASCHSRRVGVSA